MCLYLFSTHFWLFWFKFMHFFRFFPISFKFFEWDWMASLMDSAHFTEFENKLKTAFLKSLCLKIPLLVYNAEKFSIWRLGKKTICITQYTIQYQWHKKPSFWSSFLLFYENSQFFWSTTFNCVIFFLLLFVFCRPNHSLWHSSPIPSRGWQTPDDNSSWLIRNTLTCDIVLLLGIHSLVTKFSHSF